MAVRLTGGEQRGALESGTPCVRLDRPGHLLDPTGPTPTHIVGSFLDVPAAVRDLAPARPLTPLTGGGFSRRAR